MVLPLLNRQRPQETWETLQEDLNQLASFAREEALTRRKIYRIVFQQKPQAEGKIFVEEEHTDPEQPEKKTYNAVPAGYQKTSLTLENGRTLRAVYIGKRNVLTDQDPQAFCYVIPDGMMQPVTIQIVRAHKNYEEIVSFQLNPFMGSFDRHDGKLKPE